MSAATMESEDHVLISQEGSLGRINLNRPKAPNGLTKIDGLLPWNWRPADRSWQLPRDR